VGAGAHFIGSGRRCGVGEAADGGGVLIPISFERVKREEEMGRCRHGGDIEGDDPTLRFDFTWVREGCRRWHMARRHGPKGSGLCRPVGN
jgi:hypothetical protein